MVQDKSSPIRAYMASSILANISASEGGREGPICQSISDPHRNKVLCYAMVDGDGGDNGQDDGDWLICVFCHRDC